jgi:hypothetical protein
MEEDANVFFELLCVKKEVVRILDFTFSFLRIYEENKIHKFFL